MVAAVKLLVHDSLIRVEERISIPMRSVPRCLQCMHQSAVSGCSEAHCPNEGSACYLSTQTALQGTEYQLVLLNVSQHISAVVVTGLTAVERFSK